MADEIDSRMDQIRLKSEELEKKHKEILEDEEEAKKKGAIISLKEKSANSETKHRYDDIDLDFDVKAEEKQHSKNPDYKPKNVRKPMLDKKYLDEIPPDPVNFLREEVAEDGSEPKPPQNQQQHRNRRNPRPARSNNQGEVSFSSNSTEGRPSRQPYHNNNPRPRPQNNNRGAHDNESNTQNLSSPRKIHPQALRTERRTLPQDTSNNNTAEQATTKEGCAEKSPTSALHTNRPKRPIQKQQQRPNRDGNNERNNLTVQITDDSVRSVKIKPTERVGSGRIIGHGNMNPESPEKEKPQSGDRNKNRNSRKRTFKPPKANPEYQHPILDKIVVSKTSVQERILRSQRSDDVIPTESKISTDSSQATPEIIESSK